MNASLLTTLVVKPIRVHVKARPYGALSGSCCMRFHRYLKAQRSIRHDGSVSMGNRVGAACGSAVSKLFRILSKCLKNLDEILTPGVRILSKYLKNLDEIRKNLCGFQSYMRGHHSASRPALGPKPAGRWEHGVLLPPDGSASVR